MDKVTVVIIGLLLTMLALWGWSAYEIQKEYWVYKVECERRGGLPSYGGARSANTCALPLR